MLVRLQREQSFVRVQIRESKRGGWERESSEEEEGEDDGFGRDKTAE